MAAAVPRRAEGGAETGRRPWRGTQTEVTLHRPLSYDAGGGLCLGLAAGAPDQEPRVRDVFDRFDAFRQMTDGAQTLLARNVVRKSAERTAAVLHKGQAVSGAYLVLEGRLRVFTIAPNGSEATLYFIDPGETCVLALNCLFNDLLYPAWVQAELPTTTALIPGPVYRRLFATEPVVQNLTVQALSTLVFRLMGELEHIHASHHKERLAQFILLHASADGTLRLTQQQLAQHLGTSREVIARLVRDLVARGMLQTQRGLITIRNVDGLRAMLAPGAARNK